MSHIAILGAGNMATALALLLSRHKREVRLYCIEKDVEEEINRAHRNTKYLAGIQLPVNISAWGDIRPVVEGAKEIFVVVPSFAIVEVLEKAKPYLRRDAVFANVTKGFDQKTLKPIIDAEINFFSGWQKRWCNIGGPAIATEIAKGSPTAIVLGGSAAVTRHFQKMMQTETLRVALSADPIGIGYASALKNPYSIALGLCDGLGYPTNTKASMLTLAIGELALILDKVGAESKTAFGLAGLGDLVVSGFSPHGRNRSYGEKLVKAASKDPSVLGLTTVEGISAVKIAMKIIKRLKIKAPLLETIHQCLKAEKDFSKPFVNYLRRFTP